MTPKEIYDDKRKKIINRTKLYFDFLITEFEFDIPLFTFTKQPNRLIIADQIEFLNANKNIKIVLSNSHHPKE